jgi:hypothetical protein
MRRFALLLIGLPILAGCAGDSGWTNPKLPKDQADTDLSACRGKAENELGPSAYIAPGDERTSNPMKMVDQTNNAKLFETLVASCMAAKGYRHPK